MITYDDYIIEGTMYFQFSEYNHKAWGWFFIDNAINEALYSNCELFRFKIDKNKEPVFKLIYRPATTI